MRRYILIWDLSLNFSVRSRGTGQGSRSVTLQLPFVFIPMLAISIPQSTACPLRRLLASKSIHHYLVKSFLRARKLGFSCGLPAGKVASIGTSDRIENDQVIRSHEFAASTFVSCPALYSLDLTMAWDLRL